MDLVGQTEIQQVNNKNDLDYNTLITIRSNIQNTMVLCQNMMAFFQDTLTNVNQLLTNQQANMANSKPKPPTQINLKTISTEEMDIFIRENCNLNEEYMTKMADLKDAFNKLYNRDVSLIAFSKKFNEVSVNYPVTRVNVRVNSQGGLWIKGINVKVV
jgi:hypothetical protein